MKIKLKVTEIVDAMPILEKLTYTSLPLPVWYKVRKNFRMINTSIQGNNSDSESVVVDIKKFDVEHISNLGIKEEELKTIAWLFD